MNRLNTKTHFGSFILHFGLFIFLILLSACAEGPNSSDHEASSDTGAISFTLQWEESASTSGVYPLQLQKRSGDVCVDYGISTISAEVYNSSDARVASDSWPCSTPEHKGTIPGVAPGSGMYVIVEGIVGDNVHWRGQTATFTVSAGQTTDAGKVDMNCVGSGWSFDNGTLQGWDADGLWHVTTNRSVSSPNSVWYGDEITGNYNYTHCPTGGYLTSPWIWLSADPFHVLSFDYFLGNGCPPYNIFCDWDRLTVEILTEEGDIWYQLDHLAPSGFNNHKVNLYGFANTFVKIRFSFDDVRCDPDYPCEGAYVDNVAVTTLDLSVTIAIVYAAPQYYVDDVHAKLVATGFFESVSMIDASTVTPSLVELQSYDAVLVLSDTPFLDREALGDVLAHYVESGGGVVVSVFANTTHLGLLGYFDYGNFWAVVPEDQTGGTPQTLVPDLPGHPILHNVISFNGGASSFGLEGFNIQPDATLIAHWDDGRPLIVTRLVYGVRRVDLGFYPPSSDARDDFWDSTTDGDLIMANALLWVTRP